MTIIRVQLISKNNSTRFGEPIEIKTDYVPRVGELMDFSEEEFGDKNPMFIVNSVVSQFIKGKGFVPYIRATQFHHGSRNDLLEEFGWLPQNEDTIKQFDEDSYEAAEKMDFVSEPKVSLY